LSSPCAGRSPPSTTNAGEWSICSDDLIASKARLACTHPWTCTAASSTLKAAVGASEGRRRAARRPDLLRMQQCSLERYVRRITCRPTPPTSAVRIALYTRTSRLHCTWSECPSGFQLTTTQRLLGARVYARVSRCVWFCAWGCWCGGGPGG
jgi:hypothetical protein